MSKEDLLELVYQIDEDTWGFDNKTEELDNDLTYLYKIGYEIVHNENINREELYNKLTVIREVIRFKHGFERTIIDSNKELKEAIENLSLSDENLEEKYNTIREMYDNYVNNITDLSFLQIKRDSSNEGLFLALESLKSLIINDKYRSHLKEGQVAEILIDCVRLTSENKSDYTLHAIENKYKDLIQEVWKEFLSDTDNKELLSNSFKGGSFSLLYSNISGFLSEQAFKLIERPKQSSCSMISSNFVGLYNGITNRIGFIYPNTSNIIMASDYDLCSNVFGEGAVNKEKGTSLITPEILEKYTVDRAKEKGDDLLNSSCYNEVLVDSNSKPCGIVILGLGEGDLNINYDEAVQLASDLELPLYEIDFMDYKDELSEADKKYIAYHSVLSYMGLKSENLFDMMFYQDREDEVKKIYNICRENKEQISQIFIDLKSQGQFSKETMMESLAEIISKDDIVTPVKNK